MGMKISVRQICFILIMYTAVSKFIVYPTVLSHYSGRDLLFSALADFAVQAVIVWAVSFLCSRTDKTFFALLEGTFGNITARIIFGLFALFFIVCAVIPLFEQKVYVHAIFYDALPALSVFLPFFGFAVYAAAKGFQNIGRCADICLPIFIVSMLFIFAMSISEIKWDNFLPVLKTPAKNVLGASVLTAFRFFEPCWLLMFMGHFKYKKGDAAKITLSYAGGALIVLLFLAAIYNSYENLIAPSILHTTQTIGVGNGLKYHSLLLEAIRNRDPQKAQAVMREHMENNLQQFKKLAAGQGRDAAEGGGGPG